MSEVNAASRPPAPACKLRTEVTPVSGLSRLRARDKAVSLTSTCSATSVVRHFVSLRIESHQSASRSVSVVRPLDERRGLARVAEVPEGIDCNGEWDRPGRGIFVHLAIRQAKRNERRWQVVAASRRAAHGTRTLEEEEQRAIIALQHA